MYITIRQHVTKNNEKTIANTIVKRQATNAELHENYKNKQLQHIITIKINKKI